MGVVACLGIQSSVRCWHLFAMDVVPISWIVEHVVVADRGDMLGLRFHAVGLDSLFSVMVDHAFLTCSATLRRSFIYGEE